MTFIKLLLNEKRMLKSTTKIGKHFFPLILMHFIDSYLTA